MMGCEDLWNPTARDVVLRRVVLAEVTIVLHASWSDQSMTSMNIGESTRRSSRTGPTAEAFDSMRSHPRCARSASVAAFMNHSFA